MNARQKAKKYKKLAETNEKYAYALLNYMRDKSYFDQVEKNRMLKKYVASFFIPTNEIKQLGNETETHARYMLTNEFRDYIEKEIKIEKINRGFGVEYRAYLYIGFFNKEDKQ